MQERHASPVNANRKLYERIEALIHKAIHDRLESCRGFKRLEWHDWPGTKSLSTPAADAVFAELEREAAEVEHLGLAPGPIEMLCEERTSPTREDRAYQVLCALLASQAEASRECFVENAWLYVDLMEERVAMQEAAK